MPKTIAITFAGRRDRMALLVDTMRRALDDGIIDEWHLWNYARTPEDAAWVAGLEGGGVVVKTPARIVKHKYEDVYTHYKPEDHAPDDVFVKLDDDIVYLDLAGLQHMISFRRLNPQYYIVSANVVNNPTCFLLQKDLGCWVGRRCDDLHTSGDQATQLHAAFLAGEKVMFESVADIETQRYTLNINCIAWLGKDLDSVSMCESTSVNGDEMNLANAFPRIFNRPVCVFGPCVAAHLSFHTQDADMPIAWLLQQYREFENAHPMPALTQ